MAEEGLNEFKELEIDMINDDEHLKYLDEIAREAWSGNFGRTGVLSNGERLYVALAAGRMRELAPWDSIPYAVQRVGPDWMAHMTEVWKAASQPRNSEEIRAATLQTSESR